MEKIINNLKFDASSTSLAEKLRWNLAALVGFHPQLEDCAPGEVQLVDCEPVQGGMGVTMRVLVEQSDWLGINLMLVLPVEESRRKKLVEFYGQFGFVGEGELMRRSAVPSAVATPDHATSIDTTGRLACDR